MEVPPDPQTVEPQRTQPAGSQLAPDGVDRDEGDPQPSHDRLLDRFGVAELDGCLDVSTSVL